MGGSSETHRQNAGYLRPAALVFLAFQPTKELFKHPQVRVFQSGYFDNSLKTHFHISSFLVSFSFAMFPTMTPLAIAILVRTPSLYSLDKCTDSQYFLAVFVK